MKARRSIFLGVLLAPFVVSAMILLLARQNKPQLELVGTAAAIDGDTIDMHGVRIRLFGIDAPEHDQVCTHPDKSKWSCGAAATAQLAALINGHMLSCSKQDTDRYGRVVAICYAGDDIGAAMVRLGLALAYRQFSERYVIDEQAAIVTKRGMWSGSFIEPWRWRGGDR